jgi:hypothetical protein
MSVSNGQTANATTFNGAFVSKVVNSTTIGQVTLANADGSSGSSVTNIQRELNALNSFLGKSSNVAYNTLPTWVNNDVGASSDPVFDRVDSLTVKFNSSTGHRHTGAAGDAPAIAASALIGLNYYRAEWQTFSISGASGTSFDITSAVSGKVAGGGNNSVGVIVDEPNNRCVIVDLDTETAIEDAGGQRVFGRITEASGAWDLSFYTNEAGSAVLHNLASNDLRVYFKEVFTLNTIPTVGADIGQIPSLDLTADIINASATQAGKVSIGTQTFAGAKTFTGNVIAQALLIGDLVVDSTTTAGGNTVTPTKLITKFTDASLTGISAIVEGVTNQLFMITNAAGGTVTIVNEDTGYTAARRILTGTGADLEMEDGSSIILYYDDDSSRWRVVGGTGSGSGGGAVVDTFTGTSIAPSADMVQTWRFTGSSDTTMTSTPFGTTGLIDGMRITVINNASAYSLTFTHLDGNHSTIMNGDCVLYRYGSITFEWLDSATRWVEVSRNEILI